MTIFKLGKIGFCAGNCAIIIKRLVREVDFLARKGLNAEAVVIAAAELSEKIGFNNLNLLDLAQMLEIKSASLYNHIANLDELKERVGLLATVKLQECLAAAIAGKYREAAVLALAGAYRGFVKQYPELYKAYIALHFVKTQKPEEQLHSVVENLFKILDGYELTETQIIHWERILRSTLHGFVVFESAGYFVRRPADLNETFKLAVMNVVGSIESTERMNRFKQSDGESNGSC